jgi:ribonucleoside-diphosphate reductase alpha chain
MSEVKKITSKIVSWRVENKDAQKEEAPKSTSNTRPTAIVPSFAPKRPKELPCNIHHVTIKGEKWVVLVGMFDNQPYEFFAGKRSSLVLSGKPESGKIVKQAKGRYDLLLDGGEVCDIIAVFDNEQYAWATRMVSLALRHGVSIQILVEQLTKDGDITDINKILSRVLKKYIVDGTKPIGSFVCPECGSTNSVFRSGCPACADCGISKCG